MIGGESDTHFHSFLLLMSSASKNFLVGKITSGAKENQRV
jgi:hypothetical protein